MIEKVRKAWPRTSYALTTALLCGALVTTLQGCVGMAIGTAVVGTLAATDRRTLGAQTEDQEIIIKAESRIPQVVGGAGHVNINSFNRKVLITGEVRDDAMKQAVEREVAAIDGAKTIVNELEIGPIADFTSRSNDALITGKVKASFIDEKNLYATALKVTTERGAVYLMGRVTQREATLATEIARGVNGVTKVVRVFELISEDEYRQLTSAPPTK